MKPVQQFSHPAISAAFPNLLQPSLPKRKVLIFTFFSIIFKTFINSLANLYLVASLFNADTKNIYYTPIIHKIHTGA